MPESTESQSPEQRVRTPGGFAAALFEIVEREFPKGISGLEKKKRFEAAQAQFSSAFEQKVSELEFPPAVEYGKFVAGRRIPAKRSGSLKGGRVPGLQWDEVAVGGLSVEALPKKLQDAMDEEGRKRLKGVGQAKLPFIPGGVLWHLWFPLGGGHPKFDVDAFAVLAGDSEPYFLNWAAESIYRLNRERRFRFSADLFTYIRYFFYMLRSKEGQAFTLVESASELETMAAWDEAHESCATKKMEALDCVQPLERDFANANGEMQFRASVFFNQALSRCDVAVHPFGTVTMVNDEPVVRDIPVLASSRDSAGVAGER